MDKWWAESGSPGELSGQSNGNWVLDEILWSQVSDFLLNGIVLLCLWEQFGHFLLAQFSNITNVGHGLDLLKMHKVMNHPELVVVVCCHGDTAAAFAVGGVSCGLPVICVCVVCPDALHGDLRLRASPRLADARVGGGVV